MAQHWNSRPSPSSGALFCLSFAHRGGVGVSILNWLIWYRTLFEFQRNFVSAAWRYRINGPYRFNRKWKKITKKISIQIVVVSSQWECSVEKKSRYLLSWWLIPKDIFASTKANKRKGKTNWRQILLFPSQRRRHRKNKLIQMTKSSSLNVITPSLPL